MNDAGPALSVIVPCLNEVAIVRDALYSLQFIRHAGHELIVVDGGSDDGTGEAVGELADQLLTVERGRARQMNAGAAAARGRVLWFLHLDTQVSSADLNALLKHCDGSSGCWGRFDIRLSGERPLLRMVEFMMNLRSRYTGIATGDQGIFVSRDLFDRVGGFPAIALMEDIAISRDLKRHARPICLRQTLITSSRRWETKGIWRTVFLMWRLRLRFFLGADPKRLADDYGQCSTPTPES